MPVIQLGPSSAWQFGQSSVLSPKELVLQTSTVHNSASPSRTETSFRIRAEHNDFDWRKTSNAFQRLKHLKELEENWDGYGAPQFLACQVYRSLDFYSDVQNYFARRRLDFKKFEPFVAPCSDGEVLFEWSGDFLGSRELEVLIPREQDQPLRYLKFDDGSEKEGNLSEHDLHDLEGLLDWLVSDF